MPDCSRVTTAVLLFVFVAGSIFAQTEVGGAALNGTVTDPSRAAISGARIVITSTETGFSRQTATTGAGLYTFLGIPVGSYTLTADAPGFKTLRRENVRLTVGAALTIDIPLEVGQAQEVVS